MKINIVLILALSALIVLCFNSVSFFRENAKILTGVDGDFKFVDSNILFERAQRNFNELQKVLSRPDGIRVRAASFNSPLSCDGNRCEPWRGGCQDVIGDCPKNSIGTLMNGGCFCSELAPAAGWEFDPKII